jgi:hypothetical protein
MYPALALYWEAVVTNVMLILHTNHSPAGRVEVERRVEPTAMHTTEGFGLWLRPVGVTAPAGLLFLMLTKG